MKRSDSFLLHEEKASPYKSILIRKMPSAIEDQVVKQLIADAGLNSIKIWSKKTEKLFALTALITLQLLYVAVALTKELALFERIAIGASLGTCFCIHLMLFLRQAHLKNKLGQRLNILELFVGVPKTTNKEYVLYTSKYNRAFYCLLEKNQLDEIPAKVLRDTASFIKKYTDPEQNMFFKAAAGDLDDAAGDMLKVFLTCSEKDAVSTLAELKKLAVVSSR